MAEDPQGRASRCSRYSAWPRTRSPFAARSTSGGSTVGVTAACSSGLRIGKAVSTAARARARSARRPRRPRPEHDRAPPSSSRRASRPDQQRGPERGEHRLQRGDERDPHRREDLLRPGLHSEGEQGGEQRQVEEGPARAGVPEKCCASTRVRRAPPRPRRGELQGSSGITGYFGAIRPSATICPANTTAHPRVSASPSAVAARPSTWGGEHRDPDEREQHPDQGRFRRALAEERELDQGVKTTSVR